VGGGDGSNRCCNLRHVVWPSGLVQRGEEDVVEPKEEKKGSTEGGMRERAQAP